MESVLQMVHRGRSRGNWRHLAVREDNLTTFLLSSRTCRTSWRACPARLKLLISSLSSKVRRWTFRPTSSSENRQASWDRPRRLPRAGVSRMLLTTRRRLLWMRSLLGRWCGWIRGRISQKTRRQSKIACPDTSARRWQNSKKWTKSKTANTASPPNSPN